MTGIYSTDSMVSISYRPILRHILHWISKKMHGKYVPAEQVVCINEKYTEKWYTKLVESDSITKNCMPVSDSTDTAKKHYWQPLGDFNFWLSLSLSETLSWTLNSGLRPKFNLTLDLAKVKKWLKLSLPCKFDRLLVRLNFGLSMYLDRIWPGV